MRRTLDNQCLRVAQGDTPRTRVVDGKIRLCAKETTFYDPDGGVGAVSAQKGSRLRRGKFELRTFGRTFRGKLALGHALDPIGRDWPACVGASSWMVVKKEVGTRSHGPQATAAFQSCLLQVDAWLWRAGGGTDVGGRSCDRFEAAAVGEKAYADGEDAARVVWSNVGGKASPRDVTWVSPAVVMPQE
ncbi:hypothetical protein K438DRAFT_1749390 [Mycena galopus ATCC 62051]|nr:hypothetical protein K438DRAFT_1749390 [Mycena galopus ATCC 62051]